MLIKELREMLADIITSFSVLTVFAKYSEKKHLRRAFKGLILRMKM